MRWPSKDAADSTPPPRQHVPPAERAPAEVTWRTGGAPSGLVLAVGLVVATVVGCTAWFVSGDEARVLWAVAIAVPVARFATEIVWRLMGRDPVPGGWWDRPWGPSKDPDDYR